MHDFTVGTASTPTPGRVVPIGHAIYHQGAAIEFNEAQADRLFWSRVAVTDDGCWEWTGVRLPSGYGQFWYAGRSWYSHRVSYEIHKGQIPTGLHVDHLCRNTSCCNPEHLEAVTSRENTLRSPIALAAQNASKTHCPHGHEYTPENAVVINGGRGRSCRMCRRWHERRTEAKRRGLPMPQSPDEKPERHLKETCANGHPFDEANTYIQASGKRRCRACARAASARQNAKRRAKKESTR